MVRDKAKGEKEKESKCFFTFKAIQIEKDTLGFTGNDLCIKPKNRRGNS